MEDEDPWWLKYMPVLCLLVGLVGVSIQVFVLYPWHLEISREVRALARKIT